MKYDRNRIRRKAKKILPLFMAVFLAGCGWEDPPEALQLPGGGKQSETQSRTGQSDTGFKEDKKSGIIQEDDNYIYVCSTNRLVKIDKTTNESQVLWENAGLTKRQGMYRYAEGSGLLLGNKIYFIESWMEEDGYTEKKALSVINTDGTGYERKDVLKGGANDSMLLQDGVLYVSDENVLCYNVGEDGTLFGRLDETASDDNLPEGYSLASYYDSGNRTLFAQESLKVFGDYFIWGNNHDYVILDPDTGEERKINPDTEEQTGFYYLQAFNQDYLLMSSYDKDGEHFCLADVGSLKRTDFVDYEYSVNVIAMDGEYLYIEDENLGEERQYTYEKVSLATGEKSVIFTQEEIILGSSPWYLMDITVQDGYVYYMGERDYSLYLMRRSLSEPSKEEVLGDALYESGIGEAGTVKSYHENIYSEVKPDRSLVKIDLKWLQVDERFPGAAKINAYLTEAQNRNIAYRKDDIEWLEQETANEIGNGEEAETPWYLYTSYSSELSEISYFDGHYLSFYQSDYDYSGGAHGMPFRIGYTFDLETGTRLKLANVVRNSKEELKEIAVKYFGELIEAEPEKFLQDALETVRESIGPDSDFYLTEEGIRLYFYPYELAGYGEGFQEVTIPYEEVDMKISLEKGGTSGNIGSSPASGEAEKNLAFSSEDWGLSFGESGTQPRGNADAADLAWYDAYYLGDDSEKVLYLTFDCGYENGNTEPILNALKKHNVQATFFVVGHFLETAPDLVKRMVEEGHAVGNHTYHHPNMSAISTLAEFQKELDDVADLFYEITGTELSPYYRPPQGKCNAENLKMAQKLGYYTCFWSLAYVDWDQNKQPSHKEAFDKLTTRVHPGAIVLLHNTSKTNGEILDELLTKWEEMGYSFKPLSELVY